MIQDKRVDANRQLIYTPIEADMASGWLGDTIMVNGTPNPFSRCRADAVSLSYCECF